MDFDDEFSALMHRAVATIEPSSTQDTVRAGIQRGRRLRRRRRCVIASEVTFGVAIVAGLAVLAVQFTGLGSDTPQASVGAGATGSGLVSDSPSPTPVRTQVTPPAGVPITPQVAAATLISLLPPSGQLSHLTGASFAGFVNGLYQYNDGHGAVQMILGVGWRTGDPRLDQAPLCTTSGDGCTVNADGSQLAIAQGPEYPERVNKGPLEWSAIYESAGGLYVSLYEENSSSKDGAITRPEPPLSVDQLTAIVTSSQWSATTTATKAASAAPLFHASTGPH